MKFKGTKGKWHQDKWRHIISEDNKPVLFEGVTIPMMSDDETKENTKLIAAAPDLLDALIRCKQVLAEYNSDKSINAHYIASKAIEKALGSKQ